MSVADSRSLAESRRAVLRGAAALALIPSTLRASLSSDPVVGRYHGLREDGLSVFKGVRYGRAERFARAVGEPWAGETVRADQFGPIAPQVSGDQAGMDEDCLFLNIWTPDARRGARRPVMVYFHGGAYGSGSVTDPLTHGGRLAAQADVVVVTVNHRLNAFGYAWLKPFGPAFADSGVLGQTDLILALQWIKAHVDRFGGDPGRVMVFGQSGGGAKIATLMAMPEAQGLFQTAATMSGQQVFASGPGHARDRTLALMGALRLAAGDVDTLATMDWRRLIEGVQARDPIMRGPLYFGPVLDGVNLRRHPFWPDAPPGSARIPMILGNTRDETRAFIDPRGPKLAGLNWENLPVRLAAEVKVDLDAAWVVDRYRMHQPDWTPEQVFYAATTAGRSWPGQVIEADARARAGAVNTWVYRLDRASPLDHLRGAAHTDDIPYVFGTLDAAGSFSGTDADAQSLSRTMMSAFSGLARSGRPGLSRWPAYRIADRRTAIFDTAIRFPADPRGWERRLWARGPYLQPGL